jgi:hypothetical protein
VTNRLQLSLSLDPARKKSPLDCTIPRIASTFYCALELKISSSFERLQIYYKDLFTSGMVVMNIAMSSVLSPAQQHHRTANRVSA